MGFHQDFSFGSDLRSQRFATLSEASRPPAQPNFFFGFHQVQAWTCTKMLLLLTSYYVRDTLNVFIICLVLGLLQGHRPYFGSGWKSPSFFLKRFVICRLVSTFSLDNELEFFPNFELFLFRFSLPFDSACLVADRAQFTAHAQLPSQPLKCQHYNSQPLFTSENVLWLHPPPGVKILRGGTQNILTLFGRNREFFEIMLQKAREMR